MKIKKRCEDLVEIEINDKNLKLCGKCKRIRKRWLFGKYPFVWCYWLDGGYVMLGKRVEKHTKRHFSCLEEFGDGK